MIAQTDAYRKLQERLDRGPLGFPATESGVEIDLLKTIFSPEQAAIATHLDNEYKTVGQIYETAKAEVGSTEELARILDNSPSFHAGKRFINVCPTTRFKTASPRNSKRSLSGKSISACSLT